MINVEINMLFYILGTAISYIILYFINNKLKLQKYIINKKRRNIVLITSVMVYFTCMLGVGKLRIGMTVQGHVLYGLLFGALLFIVSFYKMFK